ncbi:aminotransferase class IV [Methylogaea oryzae]|nr:aminotransferase class IV [Methylogaea oryzae]
MPDVYLNGRFLPLDQAQVSVLDRGFLFADGVYEVIPVYGGRMLRWSEHWRRLEASLAGIRMAPPLSMDELENALQRLIDGEHDQYVYLQITRGYAGKRDHALPAQYQPTVFAMCSPIVSFDRAAGIKAVVLDDIRWKLCHIKSIALLGNILLRQEAVDQGAAEAILARDGLVTEAAAANVFALLDGVLVTPPKGPELLPGITRDLILEIAQENGIAAREGDISLDVLRSAEEIWVTSSTREIVPVIELDGKPVGNGQAGAAWRRMDALYQDFKAKARRGQ